MSARSWLLRLQGLAFMGGGAFMIVQGRQAAAQLRDALAAEHIPSAAESRTAGRPVIDVETATAQNEVILKHTLEETGGLTFAQLPRDDPKRDYYLRSVTLRTSLGLAIMGFRVSDLVVGMGAFMAATGASVIMLASPRNDHD